MSEPLFYCPDLAADVNAATLTGDEARHAASAQRLRVGDEIALFNGRGTQGWGTITTIKARARTVEVRIARCQTVAAPAPLQLYCALPKGERQAVLVDMATQLGMTRFTPLLCARSVAKPSANAIERWRRIALEACKQSRRFYLPEFCPAATPAQALAGIANRGSGTIWVAHPGARATEVGRLPAESQAVAIFVGPEGGFTDDEVAQLVGPHVTMVTTGREILRIETAAVALLAHAATTR